MLQLPKILPFEVQDALVMHQNVTAKQLQGRIDVSSLVDEYVDACAAFADVTTARDTHGDFIVQVEAMRGLLTAQRMSKGASSASSEQQRVYIVRSEWGKEYYSRTTDARNAVGLELAATITELAALWACGIPNASRYGDPTTFSSRTLVFPDPGIILQKYPTFKLAKDYVNGLHAIINAPLSRLHAPFACAVEITGAAFVGMTISPIRSVLTSLTRQQEHCLDAVVATLRMVKTAKSTAAGGASAPPELAPPEVRMAFGTDGRLYAIDMMNLPQRGDVLGNKAAAAMPRRELLFGVTGVATSPSSPVDFTLKYRMRPVFEHLLGLTGNTSGNHATVVSESFTRSAMHVNQASISTYIAHIYGMLLEQERNFQQTHDAAKHQQSAIMKQQYQARKRKFELCRSVVVTEVLARVAKRFVREAWRRLATEPTVRQTLADMILDKHPDTRAAENALNGLFIGTANKVIQRCFPAKTPPVAGAPNAEMSWTEKDQEALQELLFIANDTFIKRQLQRDNLAFTATLADIDFTRAAFCIGEQLGLPVTFDGKTVAIDASANVLDHFFNLDAPTGGPLRRETVFTNVELPICFKAGSKAKLVDFAALQQRIAVKITQEPRASVEQLMMARYIHLLASDVTVAHRGYCLTIDYDEVVAPSTDPVLVEANTFFELDISFRRALLMGVTEPVVAAKALGRFADKSRGAVKSPEDHVQLLAQRIVCLCRLCEHSNSAVLLAMLQGAIEELNSYSGYVAPNQRRKQATDPSKATLRIGQCAHLYLPPLTILVRCVLQPDPSRPHNERLASAINLSCLRRDVIVAIYGEMSYEAGVAADNIGSICSNNKFDLEKAEEEFEKAVSILSEVQPEGPAVFVTQNNLAFLYLRKAEMLKKNLRGINSADGNASRTRVHELLEAAETLLGKVISAESSVAPLDFATACNNMANIMLFRNRHKDAAEYFERTLAATERYANPADEPHCRLHAQKNLRILSRRRYMNAVLRIQMYVRRFVKNLRNRKAVVWTRAATELQRVARGMISRRESAMKYRFSAFHYWIRQPSIYFTRLPAVMHGLPPQRKLVLWRETVEDAIHRLSRVLLGSRIRHNIGRVYNFERAHALKRRPEFEAEVDVMRTKLFSRGYVDVKTEYALELQYQLFDLQQRSTKMEAVILHTDLRRVEQYQLLDVFHDVEYSSRAAITKEWQRCALEMYHATQLRLLEEDESAARTDVCRAYFFGLHDIVHEHVVWEEETAFDRNVQTAQGIDFIHLVEHRMRHQVLKEYELAVRGVYLAFKIPRIGRAYFQRRALGLVRRLFAEESFQRRLLASEEQVVLSLPHLQQRWDYVFHEWNEAVARGVITAAADSFWAMKAPLAVTAVGLELRARLQQEQVEKSAFAAILVVGRLSAAVAQEREKRRELVEELAMTKRDIIVDMERNHFAIVNALAAEEFRVALIKSIDFIVTYIASQEARGRHAIEVREEIDGIDNFEAMGRATVIARQHAAFMNLAEDERSRRLAVARRELLVKTEAATRSTISAYEHRYITQLNAQLQAAARMIVEREHAVVAVKMQLIECDRRERIQRDRDEVVMRVSLAQHNVCGVEHIARCHILEKRESDLATYISSPMQDSLAAIQAAFLDDRETWKQRWRIEQAQDLATLEIHHRRRILQLAMARDTWNRTTMRVMKWEGLVAEEVQARREMHEAAQQQARVDFGNHLLDLLRLQALRQFQEFAAEAAPLVVQREEHHRATLTVERDAWVDQLCVQRDFVESREAILKEHDVGVAALFLAQRHHHWTVRLWMAQLRTMRMSILSQSFDVIVKMRHAAAVSSLQRFGRGLLSRVDTRDRWVDATRAARVLQRVCRGLKTRRALVFRAAEEVEHCMHYASEDVYRVRIESEEEGSRNRITLHAAYSASRFAGLAPPPPPRPSTGTVKGLNARVYSTPQWTQGGAMFRQKRTSQGLLAIPLAVASQAAVTSVSAAGTPVKAKQHSDLPTAPSGRGDSLAGSSNSSSGSVGRAPRPPSAPAAPPRRARVVL